MVMMNMTSTIEKKNENDALHHHRHGYLHRHHHRLEGDFWKVNVYYEVVDSSHVLDFSLEKHTVAENDAYTHHQHHQEDCEIFYEEAAEIGIDLHEKPIVV